MIRTLIACRLCPCRFLTQADLDHHHAGFTDDPAKHIRRYVSNMTYPKKLKRKRGRELYKEYLIDRGIKPRKAPKKPKKEAPSHDQMLKKYAGKIDLFRHNYCGGSPVNRPPCRPPLPGSWLREAGKEGRR